MQELLIDFWHSTGFHGLEWGMVLMWAVVALLLYLAIAKQFEPLLLVPISLGAMLANLPISEIILAPPTTTVQWIEVSAVQPGIPTYTIDQRPNVPQELRFPSEEAQSDAKAHHLTPNHDYGIRSQVVEGDRVYQEVENVTPGGLLYYINQGVVLGLFPPIIFLGVGALTDFGPLIANPRTLLLGGAAQIGIFATFLGAAATPWFTLKEAASIGIIGGADGPTSIYTSSILAPDLLGAIAVAAYSYMALVPVIQPPIMRLFTTKAERKIRMTKLRNVSKLEKLVFAVAVMGFCCIVVPSAAPLIGMLFIGNILRECGVTDRLSKAAQNEIINIVTIFLGVSVGLKMESHKFLDPRTLGILALGIVAFVVATAGGVLMAKLMNVFSKTKINPLIGSAGVSAVPMAARVSHVEGQKADSSNYLLYHAMGPNVAGVIGSALAAGYFISVLGG
ncbi:MAG: sodium ion-translocating decarboxylase subunit beta [Verrucomicrobiota bacterium JB022]|nr:sodium ion-translocating decarboxylase subunit beta [Verrucomicrobiota bacterium JB022]